MYEFKLTPGETPLSVILSLELGVYCNLCKLLIEKTKELSLLKDSVSASQEDNAEKLTKINELENELKQYVATIKKERKKFTFIALELLNSDPWNNTKLLLRRNNPTSSAQQILDEMLNVMSENPMSLAVEALDFSFIELIKNSIDSTINKFIEENSTGTKLKITVTLEVVDSEENLRITYTDNAGGFSKEYLDKFERTLSLTISDEVVYDQERQSPSNKRDNYNIYFGGAGLGMKQLCTFMLQGRISRGSEQENKRQENQEYIVDPNTTSVSIGNNISRQGAEIILMSPLAPLRKAMPELGRRKEDVLPLLPTRSDRDTPFTPTLVNPSSEENLLQLQRVTSEDIRVTPSLAEGRFTPSFFNALSLVPGGLVPEGRKASSTNDDGQSKRFKINLN